MNIMAHHFNPAAKGFHAIYRENETNHCPGCGRTHWHIGRVMAECGFCTTALPLSDSFGKQSKRATIVQRGHGGRRVQ